SKNPARLPATGAMRIRKGWPPAKPRRTLSRFSSTIVRADRPDGLAAWTRSHAEIHFQAAVRPTEGLPGNNQRGGPDPKAKQNPTSPKKIGCSTNESHTSGRPVLRLARAGKFVGLPCGAGWIGRSCAAPRISGWRRRFLQG